MDSEYPTPLALIPTGIEATQHGLHFTTDLTQDQWLATLRTFKRVKAAYLTYLGDLVSYGRRQFGSEWADQQLEQMEFPLQDIDHADAIGRTALTLRESAALSSEHFYVLGLKFPEDPVQQEHWADLARKHQLTPLALKRSIELGRLMTEEELASLGGKDSGILTVQAITQTFTRWTRQAGADKIRTWPRAKKVALLEELQPVRTFLEELQASL